MITTVRNYYRESHVLRLKHWDIDQATPKCKIDFWSTLAKKLLNRKREHLYKSLHIQISLLLSA